jgi:hypothetical protein
MLKMTKPNTTSKEGFGANCQMGEADKLTASIAEVLSGGVLKVPHVELVL